MDVETEIQNSPPPAKKQKLEEEVAETDLKSQPDIEKGCGDNASGEITVSEPCTSGETIDEKTADSKDSAKTGSPLSESDAGITQYISSHQGFSAIIKQRYSDFIVNEISDKGETIHLTSRDLPEEEEEKEENAYKSPKEDVYSIDLKPLQETVKTSSEDLSEESQEKLQKLLDDPDVKAAVFLDADCDKEARTKMHKAIKSLFPSLNSNTVEEDGKKKLKISKIKSDRRARPEWPPGRGSYCRFVLYKENKDTMDAISLIARLARLKTQLFRYAGTKDKRAKTSQEVTAYRVTANKLEALNARLRNMMVGNFRYVKEPLTLGQLQGNHFTVVLRNVTGTDKQIDSAMTSLKTVGFINYYGMQRFGTTSIPTHHIGRELLHGKWKEAVDLILKPRTGEDASMEACREAWEKSRDPSKTLRLVPDHHSIEKTVLQTLVKQGETNFFSALQTIPRNTRLMYVHAYQSYVWNTMTSLRLKELGCGVTIGDLVLPRDFKMSNKVSDGDVESKKVQPTVVTEENLSNYGIQDVVLPLPGFDVVYPDGQVGKWYKELIEKDGLDIDNMKQKNKDYSLPGDYRHLVVTPEDVTWHIILYKDYMVPLSQGDLDVMFKKKKPEAVEDGKFRALKLEMSLPSSCYATMALREILKMDTSAAFQSTLNVT